MKPTGWSVLRFKFQNTVPPGGRYLATINGQDFSHPERHQLKRQIDAYCDQNKLPRVTELDVLIEDCTCRRITDKFCEGDDEGKPRQKVVTLKDIREATVKVTSASPGYADPGTALDRAVICTKCKLNDRSACPTCTGLVSWGARSVGNREVTGYSQILGVCVIDACLMSAGVFVSKVVPIEGAPDNCWRKA